jgi:dTDP-glucose 4,6-dehydratase
MKKILITGTCGFSMSNFIRKVFYEKTPYSFVSIDRINGNANTIYANKNHDFHIADIRDQHIIDKIFQFEKPDIVIHGAEETSNPDDFISSNVLGTQVIINACVKYKIEKLIYMSRYSVYGQLNNEVELSWSEKEPLNPRNLYSASKASAELLVRAAQVSHELVYNIVRSSNTYGPRQNANRLIPKVIKCILTEQKIPLYGQGLQIRDWTHINDNCSALLTILTQGFPWQTYNVSANQEFTNLEVVQEICNAMGKGHDLIEFVKEPTGHDFRYAVNTSKIKSLGWKPSYKFKESIFDTCEWFNNNRYFIM